MTLSNYVSLIRHQYLDGLVRRGTYWDGTPYAYRVSYDIDHLWHYYGYALEYGVVCTFLEFCQAVYPRPPIFGRFYYPGPFWWYAVRGVCFREKQNKGISTKKILTDEERSRREWRERKGFARDKARPHWYSGSKRKQWAKKESSRWNRRRTKVILSHGDPDDACYPTLWEIRDPWMWD